MDKNQELNKIRNRIVGDVNLPLLEQCYEDASDAICEYCSRNEVPAGAAGLLRDLTRRYYLRNNKENEASRSEGAISVSFASPDDIPADIKARLNRYRLVKAARWSRERNES